MKSIALRAKILASLVLVAGNLALPAASSAQAGGSGITVGLAFTIGGTSDADPDPGFGNLGFQAFFGLERSPSVLFSARAGLLPLDTDLAGGLADADLSYLSVAGEYRFPEGFFESGIFIGVGFYDLSGDLLIPDESGLGLHLGVSGDFPINKKFSVLAEISGHLVDMDYTNFFATAHVGIGYHF